MSKPLLQLSDEMVALDEILSRVENAEAPEVQALIEQALELTAEREKKVDSYCNFIRELELRSEARKMESQRLAERSRVTANIATSLKNRLQLALEKMGVKKIETPHFTVSRVKNGGKLPMTVTEDLTPDEYWEMFQTAKINKTKIRDELESGEELPFAKLEERGERLTIK